MQRRFKKYNPLNQKELNAAIKVIKSGNLSNFCSYSKEFYGGPKVRQLRKLCIVF